MVKQKLKGVLTIALIGTAFLIASPKLNTSVNTQSKTGKQVEYNTLLSAPNASVRLANWVSSASNRAQAWNEAINLHNGSEMNDCTLWVSSCLRGSGTNVPYNIAYTTYLADWLQNNGWTKETNLSNLQPGDICFASDTHAFIFLSWYNESEGLANVVDEQAACFTPNSPSYVRNLNGTDGNGWVPGDTESNDSYGAATYYMSAYNNNSSNTSNSSSSSNSEGVQVGWVQFNGNWYYNNSNGNPITGWQQVNGTWYYLSPTSQAMVTGWQQINGTWYYLNSNGAMETGWQQINGNWYYLNSSGAMETGWQQINGTWYYLNSNGAMETGWQQINGTWYYLNSNGSMQIGWLQSGSNWYYLNSNGSMAVGTQTINGTSYTFNSSGLLV